MRLTADQARNNRQRILETAARMFRVSGVEGVSVTDVMREAGFTHGGFYNHFESKEQLAIEALQCAFEQSVRNLAEMFSETDDSGKALNQVIERYLSMTYRDLPTGGCAAAAMHADAAREGTGLQKAFADGVASYLDLFALHMKGGRREARRRAIALLSGLVGALSLSRAVRRSDPALSEEILHSARREFCKASFSEFGHAK